ncbi:hypothetical protein H5410_018284 [Solanum commersonii]|uniref:Uncharacterized protein n=1 Tax=Solanum commersonii TaxID=4109 RepID=A0A9J6A2P7_SOLCO|nr:hypothetical protein H5410_018284 [Solanum commersonii]
MFWSWLLESVLNKAYRKLALQRHPDKLVRTGVPEYEAIAIFQELVNAYDVLSDAQRAWYDSQRSAYQIFFSNSDPKNSSNYSGSVPDLSSSFANSVYSGYYDKRKGFYKVYGDLFEKIYQHKLNLARKLGFATVNDFCQEDEYKLTLASDRNSRWMMEDVNKMLRKQAKRDYNVTVRGLAEFVKRRDKRVIEMQIKRNEELEKKNEEGHKRMEELEREKAERARNYVEPEWLRTEELQDGEIEEEKGEEKELYCVVCGKKFKSEKQWINHEQSKKHMENEKMAALR